MTTAKVSSSGQLEWMKNKSDYPTRYNYPVASFAGILVNQGGEVFSAESGAKRFDLTTGEWQSVASNSLLIDAATIVTYVRSESPFRPDFEFRPKLYGFDVESGSMRWTAEPTLPPSYVLLSLSNAALSNNDEVIVIATACTGGTASQCQWTDPSGWSFMLHGFDIETGEETSVCSLPILDTSGVDGRGLAGSVLSKGRLQVDGIRASYVFDIPGFDAAKRGWIGASGNMGRSNAPAEAAEVSH